MFYQVETGPVLALDATAFDETHGSSALRLAFIAHNSLGCTELLLNILHADQKELVARDGLGHRYPVLDQTEVVLQP